MEGLALDLLVHMATQLQFTFDIFFPKDEQWGGFVNGEFNGIIRHLVDKVRVRTLLGTCLSEMSLTGG